jgi:hypothetical protein
MGERKTVMQKNARSARKSVLVDPRENARLEQAAQAWPLNEGTALQCYQTLHI